MNTVFTIHTVFISYTKRLKVQKLLTKTVLQKGKKTKPSRKGQSFKELQTRQAVRECLRNPMQFC